MAPSGPSLSPPRGMRDFYPEDMARLNAIFDAWHSSARCFGFSEYDSCVVESLDLLKRKAGEEIVDQLYCFQDKSGRDLALRAEMTPSLARMVAARQKSLTFPLKWYTIAQCFRYERMTRGRRREHYQWNLDVIGEPDISAELEVISAAVDALRRLGLDERHFRVRFSSRRLLAGILGRQGLPEEHYPAAFLALDKRGKQSDAEVEKALAAAGLDSPGVAGVLKVMDIGDLEGALSAADPQSEAAEQVVEFSELTASCGLADVLTFDISVVRGLAYYTGIVFEAFDTSEGLRAIFGGGRYDNLMSDIGGKAMTGVGLGFGDVVLAEMLQGRDEDGAQCDGAWLAVGYMTVDERALATSFASAMRRSGVDVDLALHAERAKNFFARASRGGFKEAAYIGPDDASAGKLRVKDLEARSEREVVLAEVLSQSSSAG